MFTHYLNTLCRSEPYDPYVPRDPGSSNGGSGGSKPGDSNDSNQDGPEGRKPTAADDVRERIAKVTGIMEENIKRVSERGENLDSLRDKTSTFRVWFMCMAGIVSSMNLISTDNLATSAQGFRQGANRVRKVCLLRFACDKQLIHLLS